MTLWLLTWWEVVSVGPVITYLVVRPGYRHMDSSMAERHILGSLGYLLDRETIRWNICICFHSLILFDYDFFLF